MGHFTVYSGDLAFWKVATPPATGDVPISRRDDFHAVYHAMLDEVEDTRMLKHSVADFCCYNNSMGFSVCEDYDEINPRAALDSVLEAAKVLGKWGIYLDGNVFAYVDSLGHMFHLIVDREWARLFRYEHHATLKGPTPKVGMVLVREHSLEGFVHAGGELPLTKKEREKRKEERKRKREEAEEAYNAEDNQRNSWKDMMKGDNTDR